VEKEGAKEVVERLLRAAEEFCQELDYALGLEYTTTCSRIPYEDLEEVLRWLCE
jgi:hypothetical protein